MDKYNNCTLPGGQGDSVRAQCEALTFLFPMQQYEQRLSTPEISAKITSFISAKNIDIVGPDYNTTWSDDLTLC